jgi:sensor domain CHASE-containing protein
MEIQWKPVFEAKNRRFWGIFVVVFEIDDSIYMQII